MKMPGRNQLIVIIGGASVLAAGFLAVYKMPLENAQAFLDFAGAFGWKVIVGAITAAGGVKIAKTLRPAKSE